MELKEFMDISKLQKIQDNFPTLPALLQLLSEMTDNI